MVVVSDAALAVGITAIPDPVTEVDDDFWPVYVPFGQDTSLAATDPSSHWYPFDSKGRRVFEEGHVLAVVVANSSASAGLRFALFIRLLTQNRT